VAVSALLPGRLWRKDAPPVAIRVERYEGMAEIHCGRRLNNAKASAVPFMVFGVDMAKVGDASIATLPISLVYNSVLAGGVLT
jgi:hypothetical protein